MARKSPTLEVRERRRLSLCVVHYHRRSTFLFLGKNDLTAWKMLSIEADEDGQVLISEFEKTAVESDESRSRRAATSPECIAVAEAGVKEPFRWTKTLREWRGASGSADGMRGRLPFIIALLTALLTGIGIGALAFRGACGDDTETPATPRRTCLVMPEPTCSQRDPTPGDSHGLIFIGLSLSRNHRDESPGTGAGPLVISSNVKSITRQTQFDLNELQDRDWSYACETNDDGWLVGGGEGGGSPPWMLPNPDSAHVELIHIGNGDPTTGGLSEAEIRKIMANASFEPICVLPSRLVTNGDLPWSEMELRFDRSENPDLANVQERLRALFTNRMVSFPASFHMSITRKLHWRSDEHKESFLAAGNAAIQRWRAANPNGVVLRPDPAAPVANDTSLGVTMPELASPGGLYLYWNRNDIRGYFPPM